MEIPLEYFRSGLRLPLHRFIHTVSGYEIGFWAIRSQFRQKNMFLHSQCTTMRLDPTLSLLWSLHKLQASRNYDPLFEIHWKEGKALGGCLVDFSSSNKGWNGEFLMFRGVVGYLPDNRRPDRVTGGARRPEKLEESERDLTRDFAGGQVKGLWTCSHFRKADFLYNHNFKEFFLVSVF